MPSAARCHGVRVVSGTRNDTYYLHDDHLGSTGAVTDQSGTLQIHDREATWERTEGFNVTIQLKRK